MVTNTAGTTSDVLKSRAATYNPCIKVDFCFTACVICDLRDFQTTQGSTWGRQDTHEKVWKLLLQLSRLLIWQNRCSLKKYELIHCNLVHDAAYFYSFVLDFSSKSKADPPLCLNGEMVFSLVLPLVYYNIGWFVMKAFTFFIYLSAFCCYCIFKTSVKNEKHNLYISKNTTWQRFDVNHSDNDGFYASKKIQKLHVSLFWGAEAAEKPPQTEREQMFNLWFCEADHVTGQGSICEVSFPKRFLNKSWQHNVY